MKKLTFISLLLVVFLFQNCKNEKPNDTTATQNSELETQNSEKTPSVFLEKNDSFLTENIVFTKAKTQKRICALPNRILIENDSLAFIGDKKPVFDFVKFENAPILNQNQTQPFDKKTQILIVNPTTDTILEAAEGTRLNIPKFCFEDEKGAVVKEPIELGIKEFYRTSDMVLANLTTQSDGKPLETGGMFHISAKTADGRPLSIRASKSIQIEMPKAKNTTGKELFYGETRADGSINWRLAQSNIDGFDNSVYAMSEQQPEFPDGQNSLFQFIKRKMRYPKIARENGIEGTVFVGFEVRPDGLIVNAHIKRGIFKPINDEALRIVNLMPRWKAGRQQGRAVRVFYTLPIKFRLDDPSVIVADSLNFEFEKQDSLAYEKERLDKIAAEKIQQIEQYVLTINKLGWINCDRFLTIPKNQQCELIVWLAHPTAEVKLILKQSKVIVPLSPINNGFQIFNVPRGQSAWVVATAIENGQIKYALSEVILEENTRLNLVLKETSAADFKKNLLQLDL